MGQLFQSPQQPPAVPPPSKLIADIYSNFAVGNQVILHSLRKRTPPARRIKQTRAVLCQLLEPFARVERYGWGAEVAGHFLRCFLGEFEEVWAANREQFYEVLLLNCRVDLKDTDGKSYQEYFYAEAIDQLEETMPDSFLEAWLEEESPRRLVRRGQGEAEAEAEERLSTLRLISCSLLMPETIFTDRLSEGVRLEVGDLLRFYAQVGDSLSQVLHCNSLISCPLKHFVASVQEKLQRKRISQSQSLLEEQLSTTSEETRRIRRARETNNNFLLAEVRCFLESYTEFVWSYLQLDRLGRSRFGRIVNTDILYGLILKSVWGFVDWILERGFEYEEARLEQLLQFSAVRNEAGLSARAAEQLGELLGGLRDETQPQQYLKKVALLYREASKLCSNADGLLLVYEEALVRAGQGGGSRRLHVFRMRNVVDKLMRVDDSSLNGGEINYSWTTWCVMVELFRERIASKYGLECAADGPRSLLHRIDHSLILEAPLLHKGLSL